MERLELSAKQPGGGEKAVHLGSGNSHCGADEESFYRGADPAGAVWPQARCPSGQKIGQGKSAMESPGAGTGAGRGKAAALPGRGKGPGHTAAARAD